MEGEAKAGSVLAAIPGVVYGRTQLPLMPNYPKVGARAAPAWAPGEEVGGTGVLQIRAILQGGHMRCVVCAPAPVHLLFRPFDEEQAVLLPPAISWGGCHRVIVRGQPRGWGTCMAGPG